MMLALTEKQINHLDASSQYQEMCAACFAPMSHCGCDEFFLKSKRYFELFPEDDINQTVYMGYPWYDGWNTNEAVIEAIRRMEIKHKAELGE